MLTYCIFTRRNIEKYVALHLTHLFLHICFIGTYIITEHCWVDEDLEYNSMMQRVKYLSVCVPIDIQNPTA